MRGIGGESGLRASALSLLHENVQRWIWKQGCIWLYEVLEGAIRPVLAADRDVVIAAATATGKTGAAFLPIAANAAAQPTQSGLYALYLGPLKALINDSSRDVDHA